MKFAYPLFLAFGVCTLGRVDGQGNSRGEFFWEAATQCRSDGPICQPAICHHLVCPPGKGPNNCVDHPLDSTDACTDHGVPQPPSVVHSCPSGVPVYCFVKVGGGGSVCVPNFNNENFCTTQAQCSTLFGADHPCIIDNANPDNIRQLCAENGIC